MCVMFDSQLTFRIFSRIIFNVPQKKCQHRFDKGTVLEAVNPRLMLPANDYT